MSMFSAIEFDVQTTRCPLCESSNELVLYSFGPCNIVTCKQCSLVYLNPRLKESIMRSMYQSNAYFFQKGSAGYHDYALQEKSLRLTFQRFLSELHKRGMTSGRLLEIGTGYGYFLDEAKKYFSHISGIELSETAAIYAKKLSGGDIHNGTVSAMPAEWTDLDIIVLINVIEHVYEPVEFLLYIKQKLRNGGRIVIGTPDIGSFWFRILRKRWPSFKIPEHVTFYSKKTLTVLMQKPGFTQIQEIPFLHAFPLGLIMRKLGVNISHNFGTIPVWIPHTIVALSAIHERA